LSRYLALLNQSKNFADANIVLQTAPDRDPQNSALKGELIRVEAQIGGLEAGLAKARSFAENDPGDSIYDVVSAELYENAGRGKEALALLDKVAAAGPLDDNLALALFRLYSRTDDRAKAEAVLNGRLKNDPKDLPFAWCWPGSISSKKSMTAPSTKIRASSPNARLTRLR
jgi:predicted Zn-dependent protease